MQKKFIVPLLFLILYCIPVHSIVVNGVTIIAILDDIANPRVLVEAVVNAANKDLYRGSGVCGALFKASEGNKNSLQDYIAEKFPHGIEIGQAVLTPSFNLNKRGIKAIIHAVGPDCRVPEQKKKYESLLHDAYYNSLLIADANALTSIAFPFISSGIYKCPRKQAAQIAITTIKNYCHSVQKIKKIYFVLYNEEDFDLFNELLG